jgi:hypothetical protein
MRVAGKEEGKGNKEEDGIATTVACNEEGNGNGCKSNGDKGDGQASATNQCKEEGECATAEAASTGKMPWLKAFHIDTYIGFLWLSGGKTAFF